MDRKNQTILDMELNSKIFVAGSRGLVGSALVRVLKSRGFNNIFCHAREYVDLTDPVAVEWYFSVHRPEYVFLAAARVGGIKDNNEKPLEFFLENMAIETNVITNAAEYGVKKLVFLGSNCIYPRDCPQPIKEEYLLTGPLEKTNEAYALAKIAGVKLCQWFHACGCNFVSAMPCNLFGPGDNFGEQTAHIVPGLIARMHRAKIEGAPAVKVWGNGTVRREFLYSDDLARALILIMKKYNDRAPINTGSNIEMTVSMLSVLIANTVGYAGQLQFDENEPSGTPRKLLDNSKIFGLGWKPETDFYKALGDTYKAFLKDCETCAG